MVAFTTLITTVAAIASSVVSAEYLAVVQRITQTSSGSQNAICHSNAPFYMIYSWNEQTPSWLGGCKSPGTRIAVSNGKNGSQLEGCQAGGYTNGYRVCITSYGANVHNGRGQHQRCNTDSTSIYWCPAGACPITEERVLKCQGVWHNDA
jgi:hypothetical protein